MESVGIDLGSNTLRIACFTGTTKNRTYEKIVKTADKLSLTGYINNDAIQRIIEACHEAKHILAWDDNATIVAVTTQALRQASNAADVLEKLAQKTGIQFRVISGEEEGKLTLLAVQEALQQPQFSLIDIGGGSTEIIQVCDNQTWAKSFECGIVTYSDKYSSLPLRQQAISDVMSLMKSTLVTEQLFSPSEYPLCATSGTPTTVAALKMGMTYATYDPQKIHLARVTLNDILYYHDYLLHLSHEKRSLLVGCGREDLVITGLEIYLELMKILGHNECIVLDEGLREGVVLGHLRGVVL